MYGQNSNKISQVNRAVKEDHTSELASKMIEPSPPHYSKDDIYLEGGDMLVAGRDVYVGCSGRASSPAGIAWLRQYLAPDYRVHMIEMSSDVFHMDGLCMFPWEGLVVYSPTHIPELPNLLKKWDKIELQPHEYFGGNGLCLDNKTVVMPKNYERVSEKLEKKGIVETVSLQVDDVNSNCR